MMSDTEYDSKALRARSRNTANRRAKKYARSAEAIAKHIRKHGMFREEEFLESLKTVDEHIPEPPPD
ncbi:MAG: hypothetical protein KBB78_02350 [Candidatus Pacebacteria bacterium]|nr:hypothetical protein [Candidatus Paceibacterota bacterium]